MSTFQKVKAIMEAPEPNPDHNWPGDKSNICYSCGNTFSGPGWRIKPLCRVCEPAPEPAGDFMALLTDPAFEARDTAFWPQPYSDEDIEELFCQDNPHIKPIENYP